MNDYDFDFELFERTMHENPWLLDDSPAIAMGSEAGQITCGPGASSIPANTVIVTPQGTNSTHYLLQCRAHVLYDEKACATCTAPLDLSEYDLYIKDPDVFCTRSRARNHLPLQCIPGCGLKFSTVKDLRQHSSEKGHDVFRCPFPNCASRFSGHATTDAQVHVMKYHGDDKFICAECGDGYKTRSDLDYYTVCREHSAYACRYPNCDSTAAQFGDLVRHQKCHKKDVPRYPCPHCRSYRGNNGFKRKDHLRQHINGYHKIEASYVGDIEKSPFRCRDAACCRYQAYQEQNLRSLDDLTEHMRTQHNSSAYVCDKPSCERVGQNGFGTKKDLQAHIKKDHPSPFQCPHPGCGRVGSNGWLREKDMKKHVAKFHTPNNE